MGGSRVLEGNTPRARTWEPQCPWASLFASRGLGPAVKQEPGSAHQLSGPPRGNGSESGTSRAPPGAGHTGAQSQASARKAGLVMPPAQPPTVSLLRGAGEPSQIGVTRSSLGLLGGRGWDGRAGALPPQVPVSSEEALVLPVSPSGVPSVSGVGGGGAAGPRGAPPPPVQRPGPRTRSS